MRAKKVAIVTLALLALTFSLWFSTSQGVDAAPVGQILLTISCDSRPERTTISNLTNETLNFTGWTLGTRVRPRGNEPFALSGTLAPGAQVTYETGPDAIPGRLTLAEVKIYDADDPQEGAILETPYGTLQVLCLVKAGSLRVGSQETPIATTPAAATATLTAAPSATATSSAAQVSGVFSWYGRPPIGSSGAPTCPAAGEWFLLYAAGVNEAPIASAAAVCANADLFWVFRAGRWLGYAKAVPAASDTWTVTLGEAHFVHGR
jgi:hypothetical protein